MLSPETRQIWNELKKFKGKLVIIAVGSLVMAGADIGTANIFKNVVDEMTAGKIDGVVTTFGIIIGLGLIKGLGRYVSIFNMNVVSEYVAQSFRQKLQKKFMRLNLTFHNTFISGSGGLISRAMNDILVIYHGLRLYADMFREPFLAVGLVCTLFYLDWRLTTIVIIILPIIIIFHRQMSFRIKKYGLQGQEDLERITSTLKESLDGVRIIQSFNLESEMEEKFQKQGAEFIRSRKSLHGLIEFLGPITEFTMTVLMSAIGIYITYEIAAGRSTIGSAMAYFGAALMMQSPVKKVQESYVRIQETMVSVRRAFQIINDTSEVPQDNSNRPFPTNWKKITYKNVSFNYGQENVLKKINLTIHRGEVIAFVGGSGSGKSTLVNLLERFFDPTEGEILIDDLPIERIHLKELRHNIALVTQDVFLFSDTIERNIWAGDFSKSEKGVVPAAKAANAHSFIERTQQGYQNRVGDRGNLLSGGEKQRISIARAVFKDASILILDEATSALDSKSEVEVQKGLDALMEGRTSFVIAHRLSTVSRANRIYVMKAGEIVETGTHQQLLEMKGEYSHLHELQSQY